MLPWDWDIDTQVSEATLLYLGETMNNTYHTYSSASLDRPNEIINRTYLLDINPYSLERVNGDGFNIIDARWIDVHNGLYIDITGLSELEPKDRPGVVSCKNYHSYKLKDIYPLRETTYEGVAAMVPFAYTEMLIEEYETKALSTTKFEGLAKVILLPKIPILTDFLDTNGMTIRSCGYKCPKSEIPRKIVQKKGYGEVKPAKRHEPKENDVKKDSKAAQSLLIPSSWLKAFGSFHLEEQIFVTYCFTLRYPPCGIHVA